MFINLLPRLSDGPRLNSHKACSPVFFWFTYVYKCSCVPVPNHYALRHSDEARLLRLVSLARIHIIFLETCQA